MGTLNSRYDYTGVLYLGLLKLLARLGLRFLKIHADRFQKQRDYFYSALCHQIYRYGGGLDIIDTAESIDVVSPAAIAHSRVL